MPPEICPNCGADVPPKASACPDCGACEETGWSEAARYDGLELPDEAFEGDNAASLRGRRAPDRADPTRRWLLPVIAIAVILALLGWLL